MANQQQYIPFPTSQQGIGQMPPQPAQYGVPQGYLPQPPPGYVYMPQGQSAYAQMPQHQQASGYPGPINPLQTGGSGYTAIKLPDGTYAPVVAQMIDGKLQYVTTGSPPGGRPLQPQTTGYQSQIAPQAPPQQSYGDMYRAANDDSSKSVKEWTKRQEKERARAEKETSKKLREWEKEQRAREEAEAKILKLAQEKDRKTDRERRLSMGRGVPPAFDRERKISTGAPDLDARFGAMNINNPAAGYQGHQRKISFSDGDGYTRPRKISGGFTGPQAAYYQPPPNNYRNSGQYPTSPHAPPAPGGAPPGTSFGHRSPYEGLPGTSPNGVPPFGLPNPPTVPGGHYPSTSPYSQPPVVNPSPRSSRVMTTPSSFYREPSRAQPYTRFENFAIVWDLKEMLAGSPPLPALLLPCDVLHADWNRCMADVSAAWSGEPVYDLSLRPRPRRSRRPGSAVCDVVDIWNLNFFAGRRIELGLYRGLERYSGPTAGRRDQRLPRAMVPPQYVTATRKRDRPIRDDDSSSDSSSSSESESESDDDDDDEYESSDDEPPYANPGRGPGFRSSSVGRHSTRSRATSMSRGSAPLDPNERWVVTSREAKRQYRMSRLKEKRARRRERRKKRALRGEHTLYSLHVFYRSRPV